MLLTNFVDANKQYKSKLEKLKVGEKYFLETDHYVNINGNKMKSIWEDAIFKYISGANDRVLVFEKEYESSVGIKHKRLITINTIDYLEDRFEIITPEEFYRRENVRKGLVEYE